MKAAKFKYIAPRTLDEAIHHLGSDPDAKILSGGQSLMPLLAMRLATPSILVDLQHIAGLNRIENNGDRVRIGARVTHHVVEHSQLIAERLPILTAAARHIAHPQIRSRGTFGGSTAHADPSGEWPTVLLALGASIHVTGPNGERDIHADDFFVGPFTSSMNPDEILTAVSIPTDRPAWAFQEAAVKAGDYGLALIAVTAHRTNSQLNATRLSVGAAVGTVTRLTEVEDLLNTTPLSTNTAHAAGRIASETVRPISDIHGSSDYRRALVGNLVRRAVLELTNGA